MFVFSHIDPLELVQLTLYLWYARSHLSICNFFFLLHFFSLLFAWPTFYGFVFIFEQQSSKLEIYHKKLKTKKDPKKPLYRHFGHEKYQCYKKKPDQFIAIDIRSTDYSDQCYNQKFRVSCHFNHLAMKKRICLAQCNVRERICMP